MHGPPWCLLLCALFHWHEKWAELVCWSLQAGSLYESGCFCSFWWLTRKMRREKRRGIPTLPLNYLTKSSEDAGEHQRETQASLPLLAPLDHTKEDKKEQVWWWQEVATLETLFSTAAIKSGLSPPSRKNCKSFRDVVSFYSWRKTKSMLNPTSCFFSSGI